MNRITNGVIWKEVLIFFLPIVLSAFFQHFYVIVDGIIVGKNLGDIAFSSVGGSAAKISVTLINFFVGVSSGICAYTSTYYGMGDKQLVKKVIVNGSLLFLIIGLILSCIGFILTPSLLSAMNTPKETMGYATTYLKTFFGGLVFTVMYNTFSGVLRAMGNTRTPLLVLIFCSIMNVVLDIIFVVILSWGVFGAAFATLMAQAVSAVVLGIIVYKLLPKGNMLFYSDMDIIKNICKIGVPAGLQSVMYSLSNILIQSSINSFGYITVSAWAAYVKIDSIVDIFVSSLAATVITFVGQNLGAGKFDRVKQSVKQITILSYAVTVPLVGMFIIFRIPLMSMFTDNSEVLFLGSKIMLVVIPMYLLGIPYQIFSQALRGLGKSFVPMLFTLVGIVGFRFLWIMFVFPSFPTILHLGICYPISSFCMTVIFTVYYLKTIKKYDTNI